MDCKFFHCDQFEGEWCEKYPIPRCHNRGGCEYEDEGKTNTVAKVDENKKIEEICDYIFKYEHYNSFYQYAVACAKAVAEWKNGEITELKMNRYDNAND